jgi:hypothetical protein
MRLRIMRIVHNLHGGLETVGIEPTGARSEILPPVTIPSPYDRASTAALKAPVTGLRQLNGQRRPGDSYEGATSNRRVPSNQQMDYSR